MRVWLLAALLASGCVNLASSSNYVPQNSGTVVNFYACQQLSSNEYGGGGINYAMVHSCMNNRNYWLADAPGIVVAIEVVTFPVWFPLDVTSRILGTGAIFSGNMSPGDGRSE